MSDVLARIPPLTPEQREAAYARARERVAGPAPQVTDFERHAYSKYPPSLIRTMRNIAYVLLSSAFLPSAVRIFTASYELAGQMSVAPFLVFTIALMSIVLAETGQVAFTIWAATADSFWLRLALWGGSLGCLAFALTANAQIVKPWEAGTLLAYIETYLPPVLVLIAAHVLKTQSLHEIESRQSAHNKFDEAMTNWLMVKANAESQPQWTRQLATALKQAYRDVDKRRTKVFAELSDEEWRMLIVREMQADAWWSDTSVQEASALGVRNERPSESGRTEHSGRESEMDGGRRHGTGRGYEKDMEARTKVFDYLDGHPDEANESVRTLAERIGIGKTSASDYRNAWREMRTNGFITSPRPDTNEVNDG